MEFEFVMSFVIETYFENIVDSFVSFSDGIDESFIWLDVECDTPPHNILLEIIVYNCLEGFSESIYYLLNHDVLYIIGTED